MRIRTGALLSFLLVPTMSTPPDAIDLQDAAHRLAAPGVSHALAVSRAARISELAYELRFSVPAALSEPITGRITIGFSLADATTPLVLDFTPTDRVRASRVNDRAVVLPTAPDHLIVPPGALREGPNRVTIDFDAGDAALNRNADFLYTLFVPARAHLVFPVFDQPDLKARWTLSLEIPAGWSAVANGAETRRTESGGRSSLAFAETPPLSTYLFAFAAGRFEVEAAERGGRRFRMFHRETDTAKVARNRDAIFDLHSSSLDWLERYTGIAYPWGKFDFVLIPSFQFGGMEHPGATFYSAASLLLDPSATQNQQLGRASLIAHETAHMWFGDLVTMRWFDDVWMKEVFANFIAAKIVNPSFPGIDHDLRFLLAHYPAAYDVDRTPGTNAIRQPLDNLDDAGSLYGAIIYQKAPVVMRQLETILGEAGFRAGVRQYLQANQFGNASWPDLIAVVDSRTPDDLAAWSRAWVEEAGRPIVRTELRVEHGAIAALALVQRDPVAARRLAWQQRLQVTIGFADGTARTLPAPFVGERVDVAGAIGLPAPRYVLPAGGGIGYAGFELDAASRAYLLRALPDIGEPLTRGAAWITLWEEMLAGRAQPAAVVDLALAALPRESDEQNVQRILGYLQRAYWRFLPDAGRDAIAPRVERVLREGLSAAPTASRKAAWFATLRDVALTPPTVAFLERVWRQSETVPGLTLAEPDFISLALELAVRGTPAAHAILDQQAARIENPDRRARFAFVRPALSSDESVRDAFFARLARVDERRREAWVLEGVAYLHHPLRAVSAEKHIPASLALIREIQRTGDIFFPKRWTDATLGGHRSTRVAAMVNQFLAGLPADYPARLTRVVLASSDELFRASGAARE